MTRPQTLTELEQAAARAQAALDEARTELAARESDVHARARDLVDAVNQGDDPEAARAALNQAVEALARERDRRGIRPREP